MIRRYVVGVFVALVSALLAVGASAQVLYQNPCKGLTASDPMYWLMSCWLSTAMESAMGAASRGFLVTP